MITVLSPAKSLDFESETTLGDRTVPHFLAQATHVMQQLAQYEVAQLEKLQSISSKLAEQNYQRNQEWSAEGHKKHGRQAVLAFTGNVYQALEAHHWSDSDMDFAAEHLRILSGLYGLLAPTDLILPYRLEMGTKIKLADAANLYQLWKEALAQYFLKVIASDTPLLNLASNEYFKALQTARIAQPVTEVVFKDKSKSGYRVISFYAKKARGMMANFVVQNRIERPSELKDFTLGGYYFDPKSSNTRQLTFLRDSL